jgi:hypothetical protein
MGGVTMAAKKPAKADPDEVVILSVKCRREWRDWATALAKRKRASLATLIDQLLTEEAKKIGIEEPPAR